MKTFIISSLLSLFFLLPNTYSSGDVVNPFRCLNTPIVECSILQQIQVSSLESLDRYSFVCYSSQSYKCVMCVTVTKKLCWDKVPVN